MTRAVMFLARIAELAVLVLRRLIESAVIGLMLSFVVVVLMAVWYRYVLNASLIWTEEAVRFSLFWMVLLATALVSHDGAQLRIELLERTVPAPLARLLRALSHLLTLLFCVILAWQAYKLAMRSTGMSPALRFPMAWVYAAMIFGGAATFVMTLRAWIVGAEANLEEGDAGRTGGSGRP